MTNDETPIGVIIFIVTIALFGVGMVMMGSVVSEKGNITQGRNEGIIFCSEKPKECAVEYSYIKLKEAQK
jgi:hypothetical protein